jgi:hypothetical protein
MAKPRFADVTSKEELFGFSHFNLKGAPKRTKKKGADAKRQVPDHGATITSKVKSYKRSSAGTFKARKIAAHTRKATYWGPAVPIRKAFIYRIDTKYKIRTDKQVYKIYQSAGKGMFKSLEEMIKYAKALPRVISEGIIGGFQVYREFWLKRVPQRSGRLRETLLQSISDNLPKARRRFRFPYIMRVGVNLKYAWVVNNYTQDKVQIRHDPGDPKGNKGDPDAEYNFWGKFPKHMMDATRLGIMKQAALENMEYKKLTFFLRSSPDFL